QWYSYVLPLLAACVVHLLLAFLMVGGFNANPERQLVSPHKVIQASLVELKPKAKTAARKKPPLKKAPVAKDKPVPEKKALAKKPAVKKRAASKEKQRDAAAARQREAEQRERARMQALLAQEEAELAQAAEFEQVAAYVALMRAEIASRWSRPPSARNYMEVLLSIRLLPNGDVVSVAVKKSSGNIALDRSAVHAVEKVGRFDMLSGMPGRLFERNFRSIDIIFRPEDLRL
ncbi:MAG: cell envelope integrity protein TolA, partial [Pseudomonadales bacterium]|nr:cell envelope integrity protein TolA [Pseudomonadales bacterium]